MHNVDMKKDMKKVFRRNTYQRTEGTVLYKDRANTEIWTRSFKTNDIGNVVQN